LSIHPLPLHNTYENNVAIFQGALVTAREIGKILSYVLRKSRYHYILIRNEVAGGRARVLEEIGAVEVLLEGMAEKGKGARESNDEQRFDAP